MTSKPPPIPTITAPPIQTYQSMYGGSPEEQAYARVQAQNAKQTAFNKSHKGGGRRRRTRRRRRRTRRRRQRGGTLPKTGGADPGHMIIPQSSMGGAYISSPQNPNTVSVHANQGSSRRSYEFAIR